MTQNRFFFQDGFGDLCKLYVLLESQTLTSSREEKAAGWYQGEWRKLFIFIKSSGIFQILPIIFWFIRTFREHRSWLESKQRRLGRGPLGDGPEGAELPEDWAQPSVLGVPTLAIWYHPDLAKDVNRISDQPCLFFKEKSHTVPACQRRTVSLASRAAQGQKHNVN